jgi:hypothetical protein
MNVWKLIDECGAMPFNEILLVALTDFSFSCMISSNDFIKWLENKNHNIKPHIGLDGSVDMTKFTWVKVI